LEQKSNLTRLEKNGRILLILGTAHVSSESVEETRRVIREEKPDHVCVELDSGRLHSLKDSQAWEKLDLGQVIRQGKGFLLMANLVLSGFQKRIGKNLDSKPGAEMLAAVTEADSLGIPVSLIDREVSVTLRRAWARSGFWAKNKLIAALLGSAFDTSPLEKKTVENLKQHSELDEMMNELSKELPRAKEVLIDERDALLALGTWEAPGVKILSIVGAGHVPGMTRVLGEIADNGLIPDREEISKVPPPGWFGQIIPWLLPLIIVGVLGWGLYNYGLEKFLSLLGIWSIFTGGGAALGSLIAFAHPLTILLALVSAPITTLHPLIGVGMLTGVAEAYMRKPRVGDFQNLQDDTSSIKGFYRNRITRTLLVMVLSSLGAIAGTFVAGSNWVTQLIPQ